MEEALGLPPGAWQRRRLYALRARNHSLERLGVRMGDILVIEPGERLRPSQLVVVREGERVALRRSDARSSLADDPGGQLAMLPMMKIHRHVIGTVVGALRRDRSGALRPSSAGSPAGPSRNSRARSEAERRTVDREQAIIWCESLLVAWSRWSATEHDALAARHEDLPNRCAQLGGRLATLVECMRQSRSRRLFEALLREVDSVLSDMRRLQRALGRRDRTVSENTSPPLGLPPGEERCADFS